MRSIFWASFSSKEPVIGGTGGGSAAWAKETEGHTARFDKTNERAANVSINFLDEIGPNMWPGRLILTPGIPSPEEVWGSWPLLYQHEARDEGPTRAARIFRYFV
jgi:hypothetical protein